jgi:hypothetical protein
LRFLRNRVDGCSRIPLPSQKMLGRFDDTLAGIARLTLANQ